MKYIRGTTDFRIEEPVVLSLGKFDGLHMGHKLLLEYMRKKKQEGHKTAMFTFDVPPKNIVEHQNGTVLTTNREKELIFERNQIDYLIEYPFTEEVRSMEPEAFLQMLTEKMDIVCVVAGKDFHFGHHRRGDGNTICEFGKKNGFETLIVDKKQYHGRDISSTYIRECICQGDMERANLLLGYDYFVYGEVVHGKALGRTLGIPTVNLIPPKEKLLPPFGVYVSIIHLDGKEYGGITNVGRKPTIQGDNPVGVETNIFDFSQDVYGREIEIRFLHYLRPERKFDSVEALSCEMQKNMQQGKEFLKEYKRSRI